jgi:hypothetical protein
MWGHRWWVEEYRANISPESNPRDFFLAMVKTVEQYAPNNWKNLFKRLIVPRVLPFSLAAESTFSRDFRIANELAAEFLRRDNSLPVEDPASEAEGDQFEDNPPGYSQSLMVIAETETDARNDLDWIVTPIPPRLASLLESVSKIRYPGKRHPWENSLDTAMLEFVYQRECARYSRYLPTSEGYWAAACAAGLSQRGPDTLRNRWKNGGLKEKFDDYKARRENGDFMS